MRQSELGPVLLLLAVATVFPSSSPGAEPLESWTPQPTTSLKLVVQGHQVATACEAGIADEEALDAQVTDTAQQLSAAFSKRALLHERLHRLESAIDDLGQAIKWGNDDLNYFNLLNRANLYSCRGRFTLAQADCDAADKVHPDTPMSDYFRAQAANGLKQYREALRYCDKGLADLETHKTVYGILLDWNLYSVGMGDEQLERMPYYGRTIVEGDDFQKSYLYNAMGNAYGGMHEYEKAVDCFNRAIAIDPTQARYYANRAIALRHLGKRAEAQKDLEFVLRCVPNLQWALALKGT